MYPVYPALLGAAAEGRVPRAVRARLSGSVGRRVGAVGRRRARRRARLEEPRVATARHLARAEGGRRAPTRSSRCRKARSTASSSGFPRQRALPHGVIPLGFEPEDFAALRAAPRRRALRSGGRARAPVLRRHAAARRHRARCGCCCARSHARARDDPAAARLRLHFFGTSNQSASDRVSRAADGARVRRRRRRHRGAGTARLPRRAVGADARLRRSCCSAARSAHYTASKLYPALLAQRPMLALFHEASSVVSILRAAGSEPTVRVVTYGDATEVERPRRRGRLPLRALAAASRPTIPPTSRWIAPPTSRHGSLAHRLGAPSSIGWPHEPAGPSDRGADAPDSVRRAVVSPHRHANAPEIELTVVHATELTPERPAG